MAAEPGPGRPSTRSFHRLSTGISRVCAQSWPIRNAVRLNVDLTPALPVASALAGRAEWRLLNSLPRQSLVIKVAERSRRHISIRTGRVNGALAAWRRNRPAADASGRVAEFYEEKLQRQLNRVLSIIGPAAIILISVVVSGLIVSVMTALLSVTQLVG